MENIWIILLITIVGPIIGSLIGIMKSPSKRFTFNMLAFAAGVMLTISFVILIPQAISQSSGVICALGIIVGAIIIYMLDKTLPHVHPEFLSGDDACKLKKSSYYITAGLFIHNIPEGMVIAIGALSHTKIGMAIAISMAVQKIPEGICTSAPNYYCTKDRWRSFLISCMTILPLMLGFFLTYFIFTSVPITVVGFLTALAAGLMIYISVDELIPTSSKKLTDHTTIIAFIVGVLFVILLNNF